MPCAYTISVIFLNLRF